MNTLQCTDNMLYSGAWCVFYFCILEVLVNKNTVHPDETQNKATAGEDLWFI